MYRTLGKMNGIRIAQPTLTGLSRSQADYKGYDDHIQDIQTGRVPQEPIKVNKMKMNTKIKV
jgi:hypothetical protein